MKKLLFLGVFLIFGFFLTSCTNPFEQTTKISPENAKTLAIDFINKYLVSEENKVTIDDITLENGTYKLKVAFAGGQESDSYISTDGKIFFPQGFDMEKYAQEQDQSQTENDTQDTISQIVKSEKPVVELFVMSHCPYGTQIEKGILPVVELLKEKIDFSIKFCDYAMHGEKEINEQMNQYCIQKNNNDKFDEYLNCFLENGDGEKCLVQSGINQSELESCVKSVDQEFKITENFENKPEWESSYPPFNIYVQENQKYGVQGSPTLIINGVEANSSRDPQSLLNTVCSAFETLPEECSQQLSTSTPAPGFGLETTTSDSDDAGCGE